MKTFTTDRKAQLTLMIITGLVFLVAVGMVIWIGGKTATSKTGPAAEKQRLGQLSIQPVREYIQSCLDITTMSALELLGKQGGVIYKAQGGLTPDVQPTDEGSRFVEYDSLNVSYLITRPTQNIGTLYFAQPPEYPYPSFPYVFNATSKSIIKEFYGGYYGKSLLPPLLKPGKDSIEEQLESYINFTLPKCTDWKPFAERGLSIVAGKPKTTVMIAENITQIERETSFSVIVDWQVNITENSTDATTVMKEFSLSYPLHLAKFYLFVQGLVLGEINDAKFDPRNLSTDATPVIIEKNVFINPNDQGTDDLIIVRDTQSQLRGKPFEFRILRANRYPALVWINQTDLDRNYRFYKMWDCDKKESIFLNNDQLRVAYAIDSPFEWKTTLSAIDPDEDNVTFSMKPPEGRISLPNGSIFKLYVYADDGGKIMDYQTVDLTIAGCPQE
jgi:hypothetical protein